MNSEYAAEEYEDENEAVASDGEGCLSFYAIPPFAAFVISFVLMLLMTRFAYQQVSEVDFSAIAGNGSEESKPAATGDSAIAPLFTPEVAYWSGSILRWGDEWSIDPNLVATIMQIESCGYPSATSNAGAMGIFQVMPYHFKTFDNPYNPNTNAQRGLAYLASALETHNGDTRLAIASYNGGISGAGRGEIYWPAETQRYAYYGVGIYNDAIGGKSESATLNEWLGNGGSSLCNQAAEALGTR